MPDIEYWKRLDRLLDGLLEQGRSSPVVACEVAYCETAVDADGPGKETLRFCSALHLVAFAAHIPSGTPWLCVGAAARDHFKSSELASRFRWAWLDHVTGAWGGPFTSMFDEDGRLRRSVLGAWKRALDGTAQGPCLSRTPDSLESGACSLPKGCRVLMCEHEHAL